MPRAHFKILSRSPNTRGGCLCSPNGKLVDCVGPYIVFTSAEMMDVRNPSPVLSAACAIAALDKVSKRSDAPASLKPASVPLPAPTPPLPDDERAAKVQKLLDVLDEIGEL